MNNSDKSSNKVHRPKILIGMIFTGVIVLTLLAAFSGRIVPEAEEQGLTGQTSQTYPTQAPVAGTNEPEMSQNPTGTIKSDTTQTPSGTTKPNPQGSSNTVTKKVTQAPPMVIVSPVPFASFEPKETEAPAATIEPQETENPSINPTEDIN